MLLECMRSMHADSDLPNTLWAELAHHAIYLINRTPTRALDGRMPYKVMWGSKPNIAKLHPWGCHVLVHLPNDSKLLPCAEEVHWIGFDEEMDMH